MVLEGALAARASDAVDAIAAGLSRASSGLRDPSLAQGDAGIALFFHALGDAGSAAFHLERAVACLDDLDASLFRGIAGVAFAVEQIRGGELNAAIDEALLEIAHGLPTHDLIEGLTGIGVYALERGPRGADLLREVVLLLERRAMDGAAWLGEPLLLADGQRPFGQGYYNLGVAHGIAGVQAFLGIAGRTVPEARALERRSRRWMRQYKAEGFPAYPCLVGVEDRLGRQLRSGWCHGDPGLAAAWLSAAHAAGDEAWAAEALEVARGLTGRSAQELGVTDAGLCHGAAGLAHLFLRLYEGTGDSSFAQAARTWFARALDFRRDERGVGGFVAATADGESADPGFLAGAAGIGLALLAGLGRGECGWDRLLLVSHRG